MTHQEIREALAAYALDALPADEAQEVERHLPDCPDCVLELASFRDVTAELAEAVAPAQPPVALRAAVLAAVGKQKRGRVVPLRPRGRTWALAGAVAAVLIATLVGIAASLGQRVARLEERLAAQEEILILLAGSGTKTTTLQGTAQGNVRLVFDPARGQGALIVGDLRDPGRDFVYQLWLIDGARPESAGVFRPEVGRPIVVPVAADFTRYHTVAVSRERAPQGALAPSGPPVLAGSL